MAMQNELLDRLLRGVLCDSFRFETDNIDRQRFPDKRVESLRYRAKEKVLAVLAKLGFVRQQFSTDVASESLGRIIAQIDRYQKLYDFFGDEQSRNLLVALLKYRILGPRNVRLPSNDSRYRDLCARADRRYLRERDTRRVAGWTLNRYQLEGEKKIQMHLHAMGVRNTFLLEHYEYRGAETVVAEPGDVVIDGGGCWGDTALYFAEKTFPTGQVFSCEFDPANLEILEDNLRLNPELSPRVQIVRNALWDKSDQIINYVAHGPGTALNASASAGGTVTTLSIDDLAARENLARVDFIKMDLEGAELQALQGGSEVLRRFRPKLAISLYHKPDDLVDLPEYVRKLDLGYRFFLGHCTIHNEETVLFANAREQKPARQLTTDN